MSVHSILSVMLYAIIVVCKNLRAKVHISCEKNKFIPNYPFVSVSQRAIVQDCGGSPDAVLVGDGVLGVVVGLDGGCHVVVGAAAEHPLLLKLDHAHGGLDVILLFHIACFVFGVASLKIIKKSISKL